MNACQYSQQSQKLYEFEAERCVVLSEVLNVHAYDAYDYNAFIDVYDAFNMVPHDTTVFNKAFDQSIELPEDVNMITDYGLR